jgi:hypothetical protein
MHIEHSHGLSEDEAKARMQAFGEYLKNKAGLQIAWDPSGTHGSVSGKYMVVSIDAKVEVGPERVTFEAKDPGFLWRNKAKEFIERKIKLYFDPSTPLASLPRK